MADSLPYFAYGSNMLPEQMLDRCAGAVPLGLASISDHAFLINQRGVATIVPSIDEVVFGVLWSVSVDHLAALDGFEGVAKGNYVRERRVLNPPVETDAWTYIACHEEPSRPREGYLERVLAGGEHFGLDPSYLDSIRVWSSR